MLVASISLYAIGKGLFGRAGHAMMAKATSSGGPRAVSRGQGWLFTALFAGVTFVAVLPTWASSSSRFSKDWYGSVLPQNYTLDNFSIALGHDLTVPAIANSLKFASISTVIDIFLGIAIAYVVVRTKIRGRQILDFLSMLPLAVPGLVLAFGYLAMSRKENSSNSSTLSATPRFSSSSPTPSAACPTLCAPPPPASSRRAKPSKKPRKISAALRSSPSSKSLFRSSPPISSPAVCWPSPSRCSKSATPSSSPRNRCFIRSPRRSCELFQLLGDGKFIASALGVWAMVFLGVTIVGMSLMLGKARGDLSGVTMASAPASGHGFVAKAFAAFLLVGGPILLLTAMAGWQKEFTYDTRYTTRHSQGRSNQPELALRFIAEDFTISGATRSSNTS